MPPDWRPETSHHDMKAGTESFVQQQAPTVRSAHVPQKSHSLGELQEQESQRESNELVGVALRAQVLGCVLGASLLGTIGLGVVWHSAYARVCLFLALLALFHSLEFHITARYNPRAATASAFLLQNGKAYNVAHGSAFAEAILGWALWPNWRLSTQTWLGFCWLATGLVLVGMGQVVRSVGMAQAGSNFSHLVQSQKSTDHVLVTHGIYGLLRHPSYFGFFWWGLGTQMLLGNWVCFGAYAVVLWRFFRHRIQRRSPW